MQEWKQIGVVSVDRKHLLITDYPEDEGVKDTYKIRDRQNYPPAIQLQYGRGIIIETGLGNGIYPVEILEDEVKGYGKRILAMRIIFNSLDTNKTQEEIYNIYELQKTHPIVLNSK